MYIALELTFLHCTLHLSSPSFIVYCNWAHLPTLYIAFELTFLPRALSVFLLQLYCSLRWSIVLYFAVPWCTVVQCYCPMMSCIEVLGNIVFWRIVWLDDVLHLILRFIVFWCIALHFIALHCIVFCITLHCIVLNCIVGWWRPLESCGSLGSRPAHRVCSSESQAHFKDLLSL